MNTISQLRSDYDDARQGLTYDNASPADVRDAVGRQDSPQGYVEAIEALRLTCRRCAGTGKFITRVENGQPKGPGGECFRFDGKGVQTSSDGHRNRVHDMHYINRAV